MQLAKHTVSLKPADLFKHVQKLLKAEGRFAVIFPKTEYEVFCNSAKAQGFFPKDVLDVFPQPGYPKIRLMVNFTKENIGEPNRSDFMIEKSATRHHYSDEYKELTKDFFLRF